MGKRHEYIKTKINNVITNLNKGGDASKNVSSTLKVFEAFS